MQAQVLDIFDYQPKLRHHPGPEPSRDNPAQVIDFVGPLRIRREEIMIQHYKTLIEDLE